MLSYEKLAKKPKQFLKFTGMTIDDFDLIIVDIKKEFKRTEEKRLSVRKRKRSIGAGHSKHIKHLGWKLREPKTITSRSPSTYAV